MGEGNFNAVAEELEWKRRRTALERYMSLRQSDRASADRFLSNLVKPKEALSLALRSSTNTLLTPAESVHTIQQDLCQRSAAVSSTCESHKQMMADFVSRIRRAQGLVHPTTGAVRAECEQRFSEAELGEVIAELCKSSVSLRGCYAAVKALPVGGRKTTLALANICLQFGLFATTATLREFNPIRKKGPKVVQSVSCLRPIFFSSDMAAVLDALILKRCRHVLTDYCSPGQSGGVYDALLCVLAVVLLGQLPIGMSLPILLVFLDLIAAFDVANRNDMRAAIFEAGVSGRLWLLIDDLLSSDRGRVHVGDFVSSDFQLEAGTAQGRRLSVALFNGQMRYLHDIVVAHSRGVGAWHSRWARRVVEHAGHVARELW